MLTAEEMNTLKAKVKAEMLRRNYGSGSLSQYGSADYDFVVNPTQGGLILTEHGEKTINLLLKIKPIDDLVEVKKGEVIKGGLDSSLLTYVDNLAREPENGYTSSCASLCTGLCQSSCNDGCTSGCGGNCSGSCSGSCGNNCTDGCEDHCAYGACSGGCSNVCTGCQGTCEGYCNAECADSCEGTCSGGCNGLVELWND